MTDSIARQIGFLDKRIDDAWNKELVPAPSVLNEELDDIDAVKLLDFLKNTNFESLVEEPGLLEYNAFFPYAGPKCKKYFLKIYLKHVLHLMKSPKLSIPKSSDMFINFHSYIINTRRGLKRDQSIYTIDQYSTATEVIKFAYAHPDVIDTSGYDGTVIEQYL